MKVKIINKNTNQQFDCEEVEIDGYKYYLYYNTEPKKIGQYYINKDNQVDIVKTGKELGKPILCSNNPNIEIPKVVDEVDKISEEWFLINGYNQFDYIHSHRIPDAITTNKLFKAGYNKSQETHPLSKQDVIEFYEWCNFPIYRESGNLGFNKRVIPQFPDYNTYIIIDGTGNSIYPKGVFITTEQLIEIWEQQRTITLYYD